MTLSQHLNCENAGQVRISRQNFDILSVNLNPETDPKSPGRLTTQKCPWYANLLLARTSAKTSLVNANEKQEFYRDKSLVWKHSKFLKETLCEIGFIKEIRGTWENKEVTRTFSISPLIREKKRFHPFNSAPLATLHFAILYITKCII